MHNEAHMTPHQRGIVLRVLLSRMRHDGCGGRPARAELMTGIEAEFSRPARLLKVKPVRSSAKAGKSEPTRCG